LHRIAAIRAQCLFGRLVQRRRYSGIRQQRLLAARQAGRQHDRTLVVARRLQRGKRLRLHASFSTNTFTLPPQASPTSQARSSVTPKLSSCGVPVSIACIAASATAPSMQPPLTEPAMRPDLVTAIWLPAGRGELPQVSVTVASATCSPAARQAAAVLSTSSTSCVFMRPSFHIPPAEPNR